MGRVFDKLPDWTKQEVPGSGFPWAPDILFFNGKYHLYYSISTFGSNRSCIGLATNATLDPESKDYKWVDQGKVIESLKTDDFNCIDADPVMDERQNVWLCYGSFWGGIKMPRLDFNTGKVSAEDAKLYSLAARPKPDPRPIEGAYIIRRRRLLLSLRILRLLLPGRKKQLQYPSRPLEADNRPLFRPGRKTHARRRRNPDPRNRRPLHRPRP